MCPNTRNWHRTGSKKFVAQTGLSCKLVRYQRRSRKCSRNCGLKAVVLGRTPSADAVLTSQLLTTDVIPGCFYILAFHAGGTGPSILTAQLIFIDSMGGQTVGGQIQVIGASKVANVGVFYRGIFGPAPSDLAAVQIKFTKTGTGSIDLDDVSLTIA